MVLIFIGSLVSALAVVLSGIEMLLAGGTWTIPNLMTLPAWTAASIMFVLAGVFAWAGYSGWQRAIGG